MNLIAKTEIDHRSRSCPNVNTNLPNIHCLKSKGLSHFLALKILRRPIINIVQNMQFDNIRNVLQLEFIPPILVVCLQCDINAALVMHMSLFQKLEEPEERTLALSLVLLNLAIHVSQIAAQFKGVAIVKANFIVRFAFQQFEMVLNTFTQIIKGFFK